MDHPRTEAIIAKDQVAPTEKFKPEDFDFCIDCKKDYLKVDWAESEKHQRHHRVITRACDRCHRIAGFLADDPAHGLDTMICPDCLETLKVDYSLQPRADAIRGTRIVHTVELSEEDVGHALREYIQKRRPDFRQRHYFALAPKSPKFRRATVMVVPKKEGEA